jgi:hypothetical protein
MHSTDPPFIDRTVSYLRPAICHSYWMVVVCWLLALTINVTLTMILRLLT